MARRGRVWQHNAGAVGRGPMGSGWATQRRPDEAGYVEVRCVLAWQGNAGMTGPGAAMWGEVWQRRLG